LFFGPLSLRETVRARVLPLAFSLTPALSQREREKQE
jgi:hypothetical protein